MQLEHQVGTHSIRVEGAVIFVRHIGAYRVSEAKQVTTLLSDFQRRMGSTYLLVDVRELGEVEHDARKAVTEWFPNTRFDAVLLCGAGFSTRVIVKMVAAAVRVMRGLELPFVFVSTEKDGRAWIASHRRGFSRA